MSIAQIIVTIAGLAVIAGIAWFFWGPRGDGTAASVTSSGYQEATITVKGAYNPGLIVVEHGKPVRLTFLRQETAACSEKVLFPAFSKSADLPEGELVAVEFTPEQPGEYEFSCGMGMLHGKLIVH